VIILKKNEVEKSNDLTYPIVTFSKPVFLNTLNHSALFYLSSFFSQVSIKFKKNEVEYLNVSYYK